jgi:hypothetical protein
MIVTLSPSIVSSCLGQPFNKVAGASGNLGVNGTGVEHPVIKNANIMNITNTNNLISLILSPHAV